MYTTPAIHNSAFHHTTHNKKIILSVNSGFCCCCCYCYSIWLALFSWTWFVIDVNGFRVVFDWFSWFAVIKDVFSVTNTRNATNIMEVQVSFSKFDIESWIVFDKLVLMIVGFFFFFLIISVCLGVYALYACDNRTKPNSSGRKSIRNQLCANMNRMMIAD